MLFQSDYWLANKYSEKYETILDFLSTDAGIQTLIILDINCNNDCKRIVEDIHLNSLISCSLTFIEGSYSIKYEPCEDGDNNNNKTIYVRYLLDEDTVALLREFSPILAIFI